MSKIDKHFMRLVLDRQPETDAEEWRTSEEGHHFKIETETGEIKAGFGGKLNGQKVDPSKRKPASKPASSASRQTFQSKSLGSESETPAWYRQMTMPPKTATKAERIKKHQENVNHLKADLDKWDKEYNGLEAELMGMKKPTMSEAQAMKRADELYEMSKHTKTMLEAQERMLKAAQSEPESQPAVSNARNGYEASKSAQNQVQRIMQERQGFGKGKTQSAEALSKIQSDLSEIPKGGWFELNYPSDGKGVKRIYRRKEDGGWEFCKATSEQQTANRNALPSDVAWAVAMAGKEMQSQPKSQAQPAPSTASGKSNYVIKNNGPVHLNAELHQAAEGKKPIGSEELKKIQAGSNRKFTVIEPVVNSPNAPRGSMGLYSKSDPYGFRVITGAKMTNGNTPGSMYVFEDNKGNKIYFGSIYADRVQLYEE